ncbi:MAG TPA: 2-amino-4-hydroxy-6-hydroxymethyldihydropteridine diphosphokinase [Bacteroidales bacterium]|nr:2-amino-4-hydroxy-6-hydroxymethyldihydropteridine diphosphokinase [Bacteroidales bacterium]
MKKVILGFGSNMGDRENSLRQALVMTGKEIGNVIAVSPVYETEAVGFDGGLFLNMVAIAESSLSSSGLIGRILMIESKLGRVRCEDRFSSRTIDIDILFIDDEVIDNESLVVPHPRLHQRRFVLEPLNEIATGFIHPLFRETISEILKKCPDSSIVKRYKPAISL